jgi:ribonucleotide reductase alpha subunit
MTFLDTLRNNIPPHAALVGRIKSWLESSESRLPVSCTVMSVEDGIEQSWVFTSHGLRNAAGVTIDLSKLRPVNTANDKGLVSSGAASFAKIYSQLNEILRRGGTFKNGACLLYLDADHPDCEAFLNLTPSDLPWAKKALYVDNTIHNNPLLELIAEKVDQGSVWLAKKQYDVKGGRLYSNVCLDKETWIHTTEGIKQIKDLVSIPFETAVHGKLYHSSSPLDAQTGEITDLHGFYKTGYKNLYTVKTIEGFEVTATDNHKLMTQRGLVAVNDLTNGDLLEINTGSSEWAGGTGSFDEGWLVGNLIGDGCLTSENNARLYFYDEKQQMLDRALTRLADSNLRDAKSYQQVANLTGSRAVVNSSALSTLARTFDVVRGAKCVTEAVEKTSMEFTKGFLQGYFDADGCVMSFPGKSNGKSIQLTSVDYKGLQRIQRMLLRLGIFSRIRSGHQKAGLRLMPDGKRGAKLFDCLEAHRLDISGQANLIMFKKQIGFSYEKHAERLDYLLGSYEKAPYKLANFAKVENIVLKGLEDVYDCTIEDIHLFDANGIVVSNCLEVVLPSRGTCLLHHVNLGTVQDLKQLPSIFKENMEWLCELHPLTGIDASKEYLSPTIDKQVGLGVIGLANMLAIHNTSYADFVADLEDCNKGIGSSDTVAYWIHKAHMEAGEVASLYGMERAFVIAPTANCSRYYQDSDGFTTAPEISPPLAFEVDRDSGTFGVETYEYHPKSELASEVGWAVQWRLLNAWQTMMDQTGVAHAISANIWNDQKVTADWISSVFMPSALKTTYYRLKVDQTALDKSQVVLSHSLDLDLKTDTISCSIDNKDYCESCGG